MSQAVPLPAGNIVLVGFMGSGKTAVGRCLAERTGRRLIDTDEVVVDTGTSIGEIFAAEGEAGFRRRERKAIERVARGKDAVISTGGGTVLDPANVKALKRYGVLVYLKTSIDELVGRLENGRDRPLLRPSEGPAGKTDLRKRVEQLLAKRRPIYESVADHVVTSDGRDPSELADEILKRLHREEASSIQRVRVGLQPPYTVSIGRGILGHAAELVKMPRSAESAAIVSHPRIRRLWGSAVEKGLRGAGLKVTWCTFPEGEERKSFETAGNLLRALARANLHRGDVVVALGGGVVGDVGAFVASTYARGVSVVQMPTTLLAMVDSAIGGKTGVNLPSGKNLVGTFHQPIGVVADLDALATLSERELRGGLAEVVKYGFISDPSLIGLVVERSGEILERGDVLCDVVLRSAKIKADVVAADEREEGVRAILNYGHTLGHALEAASLAGRTRRLHHGEAISVGMVYAASVAAVVGMPDLVDEHRAALDALGLPTRTDLGWAELADRMRLDKKYSKGARLVLLEAPGRPVVARVARKDLARAFDAVAA